MTKQKRAEWRNSTIRQVLARALKFNTCKAWRQSDNSKDFHRALAWGIYKQCTAHMPGHMRWSKKQPESTIAFARKYKTRSEWKTNHRASFNYAYRRPELYAVCVAHMPANASVCYKIVDLTTGKVYDTVRQAAKHTKVPFQRVADLASGIKYKKYGVRFTYILNTL